MRPWIPVIAAFGLNAIGAVGFASPTFAGLITYTDTFTASGSLGGESFTDENVVITINANTEDVTGLPSNPAVVATSSSLKIGSSSATAFLDPIRVQSLFVSGGVVITDTDVSEMVTVYDDAFLGYDLTTSIGPVTSSDSLFAISSAFPTAAGSFQITSYAGSPDSPLTTVFTARAAPAVPEPSSLMLLSAGFGGLILRRRRAKATVGGCSAS
jgi:PEP-CTERM motif